MLDVFISYSHKDDEYRKRLEVHLALLKRQGIIHVWHDRRIGAGKDIHREISENLEAADVVLLLVSSDFLASDYCYDRELARAMVRHREGSARVIPVILRVCDWHSAPFGDLKAVPRDGQPITKFADRDEGFNEVVKAIRDVAAESGGIAEATEATKQSIGSGKAQPRPASVAHSEGLRLKKSFSDFEKDRFIEDAFDSIANHFKESLSGVKAANPGVETNFRRIDTNHFSAKVYMQGKERAHCRIWFGGRTSLMGGILYSTSDHGDNSYNESLSVTDDGYSLLLKPVGALFPPSAGKEQMTREEGAEYFWSIFIEPLQR
jgi:hypothetical protein